MENSNEQNIKEICSVVRTLIENQKVLIELIKELKSEQENIKEQLKLNGIIVSDWAAKKEMMN